MSRFAFLILSAAVLAAGLALTVLEYGVRPTLSIQMETSGPETIDVFWDTGREFNESERFTFTQPSAGTADITLTVPAGVRALRVDPKNGRGSVGIRAIRIRRLFALTEWTLDNAFAGWVPGPYVERVGTKDGALEVVSAGTDPYLVNRNVGAQLRRPLNIERIVVGALVGLFSAVLAWVGMRRLGVTTPSRTPSTAPHRTPNPKPRSARKRRASKVALAAGSLIAFSGLAYIVVLAFFSDEAHYYYDPTDSYKLSFLDHRGRRISEAQGPLGLVLDPFTFFRNYPNQRSDYFTIDENGFRGGIADDRKPKVMVLGGSAAFGRGLRSDDETFTARLNHLVEGYTFINAAVVGFASGQELAGMIHHLDRFRPDTYIVFDGWNDLTDYGAQRRHFGVNGELYFAFVERLHQYHLQLRNPAGKPWPFPSDEAERDEAEHLEDVVRLYLSNVERMHAWARARGARFIVVFQPEVRTKKHRTEAEEKIPHVARVSDAYRALVTRAKSFCGANGIPYCDLNDEPAYQTSRKTLFFDAVHLNAAGHDVVARVLQRVLSKLER